MKNAYEYFYYKVYDFLITINPKNSIISTSALAFVCTFEIFILFIIVDIIQISAGLDLYAYLSRYNVSLASILIIIITHILLVYNDKYKKIISKFEKETEQQRKRGNTIVLVIIISVFIAFFYFTSIIRTEHLQKH